MKIEETVAIVAGGASGLGEACVRRIVGRGGKAVICDLNEERGGAIVDELGSSTLFVRTNVADEQDVAAALRQAVECFGMITAVLNCAGIALSMKTHGKNGPHPLSSFDKVVGINLNGSFNVARLAAPYMEQNQPNEDGERGVIINTASIAAFDGQKGQPAYGASKAGIVGMTLPMARDLASIGVRVNAIAPGLFSTPMMSALPEAARATLAQQPIHPKRLGKASEFADLACFMIENAYINAETVRLDGGVRLP